MSTEKMAQSVPRQLRARNRILSVVGVSLGFLTMAPPGVASTPGSQRWFWAQLYKADKIVIYPDQGGPAHNLEHNMAEEVTGIPWQWEGDSSDKAAIRQLIKTIRFSGNLNNGKHWGWLFYSEHLVTCPRITLRLSLEDRPVMSVKLYLYKYRGHYWLEGEEGIVAAAPGSVHLLIQRVHRLVIQAKHGGSLHVYLPEAGA